MDSFSLLFSASRICAQKEPERGCLKKLQHPAPKDCCPILFLPPEIRACIFKHLLDEVELTFDFMSDSEDSTACYTTWSQYRNNLSYLQVLEKFERETLDLVQVEAVRIVYNPFDLHKRLGGFGGPTRRAGRMPVSLRLENVRPHLRQITLDGRYSLSRFLDSGMLKSFPKLKAIRVATLLTPRKCNASYRESLNDTRTLDHLVQESLIPSVYRPRPISRLIAEQSVDNINLEALLSHSNMTQFKPISIDVTMQMQSGGCFDHDDDHFHGPISRAVSAIRFTYEWPSKKIEKAEVDMYDQPMPLAVKSRWTETVKI